MKPGGAPLHGRESWPVWSAALVSTYLITVWIGWNRVLIPDEIRPLLMATKPWSEELAYLQMDLVQTPLSFVIQRFWMQLFNHSDSAIKFLVAITNVAALVLFTSLAYRATRHWRLASVLFAAPYLRIGSAVNLARMYGLLVLLGLVAFLLWERWRRTHDTTTLVAWTVVAAAAVYTHGSGLLLVCGFAVLTILLGPQRWRFAVAACIACLSILPWIAAVYPVYKSRGVVDNVIALQKNPTTALLQVPFYLLSGEDAGGASILSPLHDWRWFHPLVVAAIAVHAALLISAILVSGRGLLKLAHDSEVTWLWIGVGLFLCSLAPLYVCSIVAMPVIHPRYLQVVTPAYWLAVVLFAQFGGRAGRAILYGVVIPWVGISIIAVMNLYLSGDPVRQAVDLVASRAVTSEDLILCERAMPLGWQVHWEWKHRLQKPGVLEMLPSRIAAYNAAIIPPKSVEDLSFSGVKRLWFFSRTGASPPALLDRLFQQGFSGHVAADKRNCRVYLFERQL